MTVPEAVLSCRLLQALYLEGGEVPNLGLPDVGELLQLLYVNFKCLVRHDDPEFPVTMLIDALLSPYMMTSKGLS